jgi:hypothetical protein
VGSGGAGTAALRGEWMADLQVDIHASLTNPM